MTNQRLDEKSASIAAVLAGMTRAALGGFDDPDRLAGEAPTDPGAAIRRAWAKGRHEPSSPSWPPSVGPSREGESS